MHFCNFWQKRVGREAGASASLPRKEEHLKKGGLSWEDGVDSEKHIFAVLRLIKGGEGVLFSKEGSQGLHSFYFALTKCVKRAEIKMVYSLI